MVYLDFSHVVDYFYKGNQNRKADSNSILRLPKDLILESFLYLGKADLKNAFLTCRQWSQLNCQAKKQNFEKELGYLIKRLTEHQISGTSSSDSRYTNVLNILLKKCKQEISELKKVDHSSFSNIQKIFFENLLDNFKHCPYTEMEALYNLIRPIFYGEIRNRLECILNRLKLDANLQRFLQLDASLGQITDNDLSNCYQELNSAFNQTNIHTNNLYEMLMAFQLFPNLKIKETTEELCISDFIDIIYNHYKIEREKVGATDYLKRDVDIIGLQEENLNQTYSIKELICIYGILLCAPCMLSKPFLRPCKLKLVENLTLRGWNPQNYLKSIHAQLQIDSLVAICMIVLLYAESQDVLLIGELLKATMLYKFLLYVSRAYHLCSRQQKISRVYKKQIQEKR
ncbi:MAG: hypothetical protein K0S74_1079 [Chlamydiales bacterium]|jgi:hypothetical protein|nr:hypothetical protein [Chlamydiales bacterium]